MRVGLAVLALSGCPSGEDDRALGRAELAGASSADSEPDARLAESVQPAPNPAVRVARDASPSTAPATSPAAAEDSDLASSPDERLGAILDADPEGAGLDTLIRAASEEVDASARAAAVAALGDSEDARALDALIAATEDPDPEVAITAIEQLRWFDDRLAEAAIRRRLDAPDRGVAEAARAALAE